MIMIKNKLKTYLFSLFALLLLFSGSTIPAAAAEFAYPNDPYNDALWSFDNPGYYSHYYGSFPVTQYSTEGVDMNIWEAWENYPLSKEETRTVIVAVIDTGIDYLHPDLADHMWTNPYEIPDNGIDDDGNGYIDDIHGWDFYNNDASICHYAESENGYTAHPDDNDNHGTHIAGIIAATADNGIGIAGVASNVNVRIMSLKIHGGSSSSGSVANAIKAIRYAEAMGADICNLSWGTINYSQALEQAIRESSMLFITASGNNGINTNSTPMFPASLRLPNLISVTYINNDGILPADANYGVSTVDVAAPGKDIYSTLVGTYGYSSGSSMAAPHVTGLAAMLYAYQENTYPAQVKELILNALTPLDSLNGYIINPGIPDAAAAVGSLSESLADTFAPFLTLETTYQRETICIRASVFDVGGSGIRKVRYAYGSKPSEYFSIDNNGTAVLEEAVYVNKAGYYTFYVEDYAGNYQLYNTYIEDDVQAPVFTVSCSTSPEHPFMTLRISAADADSGIKTFKYMSGECTANSFLFAGETLDASVEHTLLLPPEVTAVTFYATDYRDNSITRTIYLDAVPSTALYLNVTERSLSPTETFQLQPLIFPWLSTDYVTYATTDDTILSVDESGLITALSSGEAYVTATTSSGISAQCKIVVSSFEN